MVAGAVAAAANGVPAPATSLVCGNQAADAMDAPAGPVGPRTARIRSARSATRSPTSDDCTRADPRSGHAGAGRGALGGVELGRPLVEEHARDELAAGGDAAFSKIALTWSRTDHEDRCMRAAHRVTHGGATALEPERPCQWFRPGFRDGRRAGALVETTALRRNQQSPAGASRASGYRCRHEGKDSRRGLCAARRYG